MCWNISVSKLTETSSLNLQGENLDNDLLNHDFSKYPNKEYNW